MHVQSGPYHVRDIEFVAAFDVDAKKVGRDITKTIVASENEQPGPAPEPVPSPDVGPAPAGRGLVPAGFARGTGMAAAGQLTLSEHG